MMQAYLRPTAPIAPDALLPGDPKRAMDLASRLLERPLMSNLSRGLWGYHGKRPADGGELTVQSTGIGAPSAVAVLIELAALGVRRAIRVGTAAGLEGARLGERIIVAEALPGEGVSAALGTKGSAAPDAELTSSLERCCADARLATIASADMHRLGDPRLAGWEQAGAHAVDLCSAAMLDAGASLGVAIASVLVVVTVGGVKLSHEEVEAECLGLGAAAAGALERTHAPSG